uniref:Uncharacterized protein n=1 Tax=Lepeophtheirus salmonis TaxID=72036 RepID=A0A0K2VLX6_LEPSM
MLCFLLSVYLNADSRSEYYRFFTRKMA